MSTKRVNQLNNYLVGDGFWSKIPENDAWFYRLAGLCSHKNWPVNPSKWKPEASASSAVDLSKCNAVDLSKCSASNDDENSTIDDYDDTISEDVLRFFRPKPHLPAPVYRQTYRTWKSSMDMNLKFRQIKQRDTIYIQPIDDFPSFVWDFVLDKQSNTGFFTLLQKFLKVFFSGMNVDLLPGVSSIEWKVTERHHKLSGNKQLLVDDLHRGLAKVMPRCGQAIVGITWTDLYPGEELNFVLGQASVNFRSAVVCFGRFETKLYESGSFPLPVTEIDAYVLYKMMKVLAHEMCHIFCLSHCVFFECLMNESSSVTEAVGQPLFLCPICLRKLQKVCKFDIIKRYSIMLEFLTSLNAGYPSEYLGKSLDWLQNFLQWKNYQMTTEKPNQ